MLLVPRRTIKINKTPHRLALNLSFEKLGLDKVVSYIDLENLDSQAVAKRLGHRAQEPVRANSGGNMFLPRFLENCVDGLGQGPCRGLSGCFECIFYPCRTFLACYKACNPTEQYLR